MRKFKIKSIMALFIAFMIMLSGCGEMRAPIGQPVASDETQDEVEEIEGIEEMEEIEETIEHEDLKGEDMDNCVPIDVEPMTPEMPTLCDDDFTAGLTENEDHGLAMTVAVLERMAMLSGNVFRVNIVIQNNGDETIAFTHGSGSFDIPDALRVFSEDLQVILPADRMGFATTDFEVRELLPGESLRFDWYVLAAEPYANFDMAVMELFMQDEVSIANLSWEEIQEAIPSIVGVAPGSYDVQVYFRYRIVGGDEMDVFGEDTSYLHSVLTVRID